MFGTGFEGFDYPLPALYTLPQGEKGIGGEEIGYV